MNQRSKLWTATVLAGVAGIVGTLIVSVVNPFAKPVHAAAPISETSADGTIHETFHMDAPTDGIAATNSGDKPIPPFPAGVGVLTEEHIAQGFILLTKLRNKEGTVIGFTSEQEVVRSESNVMQGRLMTITTWTLTIPGRGTIFLSEDENQSEFAKKAALPALALGKPWNEPWTFVTTVGPSPDGRGVIVGGTGEFAGISGTFVEVTHLRRFSKQEFVGTIELQLAYRKPAQKLSLNQ
jgi:hypothetical protein